jgi:P27 family predicted phage terminase small subunit
MAGNANSGRRPQPTALKVLRGNPSKTRLNEDEPKPPQGPVTEPESLSNAASMVWQELAPIATAMGTLTVADVSAFATLCELESTRRLASRMKDAEGFMPFTVDGEDGQGPKRLQVDQVFRLERDTANALRPYYEKFGLEPVGRARIRVPKGERQESKWAGIVG